MTIAWACNRVLRKKFLQPERIGIIPTVGYTDTKMQSKKAIMWLIDEEQREGKRIQHGRNGREYALPELAELCVDGYCEETDSLRIGGLLLAQAHVSAGS